MGRDGINLEVSIVQRDKIINLVRLINFRVGRADHPSPKQMNMSLSRTQITFRVTVDFANSRFLQA